MPLNWKSRHQNSNQDLRTLYEPFLWWDPLFHFYVVEIFPKKLILKGPVKNKQCPWNPRIVSVHHNKGSIPEGNLVGRGKSRGQRGWIFQYLLSFCEVLTFSHRQFFYKQWIRIRIVKPILPCWWWDVGGSYKWTGIGIDGWSTNNDCHGFDHFHVRDRRHVHHHRLLSMMHVERCAKSSNTCIWELANLWLRDNILCTHVRRQ